MKNLLKNWPEGGSQLIYFKTNFPCFQIQACFIFMWVSHLLIVLIIQLYIIYCGVPPILGPSLGVYLNPVTPSCAENLVAPSVAILLPRKCQ